VPTSADGTSPGLQQGEPGVMVAATATKMWLGTDSTALGNRLLLSTVDTDTPILTAMYAKLAGATFTGAVSWATAPTSGAHLANKDYVDQQVAALQLFLGAWDADQNEPDITTATPTNGAYFIVSVGGTVPAGVPGIATEEVRPGDMIVWNGTTNEWEIISGAGMTQAEADARYVQLAGSTMTGALILHAHPGTSDPVLQAATKGYVDTAVTNMMTSVTTDTSLTGNGTSATPLSVAIVNGGTF
jgi:hypothetical protein